MPYREQGILNLEKVMDSSMRHYEFPAPDQLIRILPVQSQ
jgi:hypothetical protein